MWNSLISVELLLTYFALIVENQYLQILQAVKL